MAVHELQGKTLGEKHRHYNQLVKEAITADKKIQAGDFNIADNDIDNLIKIDVAGQKRDVEYILKVLQCEDMLYVSRAIKQSTWLITDNQYSHIINLHHLHTQLFPQMITKAWNKLLLHIRLHLKDADRVEDFYKFIKKIDIRAALKWLPHCSLSLVEKEVKNHYLSIQPNLLKRLFKKSVTILQIYKADLANAMFLLKSHAEVFLEIFETLEPFQRPELGRKATGILMKTCPQRIIDKFEMYSYKIHLPTFAKYFKKGEIIDFIFKQQQKEDLQYWFKYENLKHFVRYLPKESRFEYIKKIFIERSMKEDDEPTWCDDNAVPYQHCKMMMKCADALPVRSSANIYLWYRCAPFEVAFADVIKLIRAESAPTERIAMFGVLFACAGRNKEHVQKVLQYYNDNHINEPFKFKIQFVSMLLTKTDTFRFNETAWNTLNNMFHSMEVYIESENNVQSCIKAIILYKVLHNENIPEIVEKKFKFNCMNSIQSKLTEEEKEKVFVYLLKLILKKINNKSVNSEVEFSETVQLLEDVLRLLIAWKKNLTDHPWCLEKLKEMINLKKTNSWKTNLSPLYHTEKSLRRSMFKESLLLSPSEETLYNILKHDLELISHNISVVDELRQDDKVSLRRVLRSLRVYWSQSLAADWRAWYLARLDKPGGHKALIQGLCALEPRQQIVDIIKKYAPTEFKINWSEEDEVVLSIRKHLGRNMYLSRPLPPLETVLLYAKGDYLQFALPSFNAILHNMSAAQTHEQMSILLNAPVSLQKHVIRNVFTKMEPEELKTLFHEVWGKAKNPSIRAVLFTESYGLLCRQSKPTMQEEIWELLSNFIDNLSADENKIIYDTLTSYRVNGVPMLVRGKYLMKSFKFLKSLPPKANCENSVNALMNDMKDLIEDLDDEFVAEVLQESLDKFTTENYAHAELMASYLLCCKDGKSQFERYDKTLHPVLERACELWDVKVNKGFYARNNLIYVLQQLSKYFQKFFFEKRMFSPGELFFYIQYQLETRLPIEKNYQTLKTWQLITLYVRVLNERDNKNMIATIAAANGPDKKPEGYSYYDPKNDKKWNDIYIKAAPKFSRLCFGCLRDDIDKYFPSIYWIFANCFSHVFDNIHELVKLECLQSLLEAEEYVPSYMVVLKNTPQYFDKEAEEKIKAIREKIFSHPSIEIKMHYYKKYSHHLTEEAN